MNTVALESLVTGVGGRTGVTENLRVRVVHLLAPQGSANRSKFYEVLSDPYRVRSDLVHLGIADEMTAEDSLVQAIAQQAIKTILRSRRFRQIRTEPDLEKWFEDRLLRTN